MCYASSPEVEGQSIAPTGGARRYVPGLDGLRGIAVLLVILFHCKPDGPFQGGFIGVDLFFVLSAFLITSILVEERERTGTIRLGQFYWRRALRLMPALLFFLSVYAIVAPKILPGYPHLRDALIAGLYVSNFAYVADQFPIFIKHTWSLAAEEQFYLLWPLMLMVLLRRKRPMWLLGLAWAGLTAMRLMTGDWIVYYYGFAHHGTGLVLGAILFFLVREGKIAFRSLHALFAAGIMALLAVNAQLEGSAMAIAVAEFASAIIIGTVITNPASTRFLAAKPLVGLGKLSYGLYLWNYPISFLLRGTGSFGSIFAVTLALSLGLASLSYVTVETWARRWRDSRKPGAGAAVRAAS